MRKKFVQEWALCLLAPELLLVDFFASDEVSVVSVGGSNAFARWALRSTVTFFSLSWRNVEYNAYSKHIDKQAKIFIDISV